MRIPLLSVWAWNVLGEHAVYFSQATTVADMEGITPAGDGRACTARCSLTSQVSDPGSVEVSYPIQCGHVATIAQDGTYLCWLHVQTLWHCAYCDTPLQSRASAYCSPACDNADTDDDDTEMPS